MKGKDKCEILSEIREKIAEENGIGFEVIDCDFEGDCQGTCPKCEAEIEYLEKEINKKRKNGEKVKIQNIIESKGNCEEEYDEGNDSCYTLGYWEDFDDDDEEEEPASRLGGLLFG